MAQHLADQTGGRAWRQAAGGLGRKGARHLARRRQGLFGPAFFALFLLLALFLVWFLWQKLGTPGQPQWQQVPLVSQANREAGARHGGEGGQWPHTLEVSQMDSDLLFYGTNTGGIYRSTDGGRTWALSTKGMLSRGGSAFAIDPRNDRYVLAAGSGDSPEEENGLYASEDRGLTWTKVLDLPISGNKVYLDGLEYDPSSYSAGEQRCLTAYYSTPYETERSTLLEESQKGLYRSEDGGRSWKRVNRALSDAELFIDPHTGNLFAAREDGLYFSSDRGESFSLLYEGTLTGCDILWEEGEIYLCDDETLWKGNLQGEFAPLSGDALPDTGPISRVAVSPVDPSRILIQVEEESALYGTMDQIYLSQDGGASWTCWTYDAGMDFLPYDSFEKVFAWSYEDADKVWSFGGEFVIASENGGQTWAWSSEGICGVLCGGKFHFNIFDPDLMYFGAQDLNGAITTDGGRTWTYVDMSRQGNHGNVYGGYAASREVFWGCLAESWDEPRYLTITFDGGQTFVDTGYEIDSAISSNDLSSYQSWNQPEIFFAGNYRSTDGGHTWEEMDQCLQVYTHNPQGEHELYGCERKSGYVVVSCDEGETWRRVNREEIPLTNRNCLSEVQIDPERGVLYVAANGKELYTVDLATGAVTNLTDYLPAGADETREVRGIAVDAENGRVYVSGGNVTSLRRCAVLCSEDGGWTWYDATPAGTRYGGVEVRSAHCIRFRPSDGEIWCSTGCLGFVKLGRP